MTYYLQGYARALFDCGNATAAKHYCSKADERGEMLLREMEADRMVVVAEEQDQE